MTPVWADWVAYLDFPFQATGNPLMTRIRRETGGKHISMGPAGRHPGLRLSPSDEGDPDVDYG